MLAITIRVIKQTINDKRSLAMILLAPLLIMFFMSIILGEIDYTPKIQMVQMPNEVVKHFEADNFDVSTSNRIDEELLKNSDVDAVIFNKEGQTHLQLLEPNNEVMNRINKAFRELSPNQGLKVDFIYGNNEATTFDSMIHILLGIYSFFLVFIISGIAFVRERTLGTMERFMLSPISRFKVVAGFIIGYGIFAIAQSALLITFLTVFLNITVTGSIAAMIITMVLLSFVAISVGALVSTLAKNEFQVIQFIPIILTPQIFFSGLIPINMLPYKMDIIAQFMPIKYASSALNKIITRFGDLNAILPDLSILSLFLIAIYLLNVLSLKKYRAI